jgi:heterodisulfide reductase subunit C
MDETLKRLMEKADVRQYDCYQCGKCSGGCPMADAMDLKPRGIMRCAQVGSLSRILNSNTIWLCTGCYACVDRCPHDVNVPALIEEARYEALSRGICRRENEVLNKTFIANIKMFGKNHEMLLAGLYNAVALKPTQDVKYLPHMLSKKLVGIKPHGIRRINDVAKLAERAELWDAAFDENKTEVKV